MDGLGSQPIARKDLVALDELFNYVKTDIKKTMAVMNGMPVTVRLLDPPLHEFFPQAEDNRRELAEAMGLTADGPSGLVLFLAKENAMSVTFTDPKDARRWREVCRLIGRNGVVLTETASPQRRVCLNNGPLRDLHLPGGLMGSVVATVPQP